MSGRLLRGNAALPETRTRNPPEHRFASIGGGEVIARARADANVGTRNCNLDLAKARLHIGRRHIAQSYIVRRVRRRSYPARR